MKNMKNITGLLKEKKRRVIVEVSYATGVWPKANIQASGPRGSLKYYNFMLPQLYNSIEVTQSDTGFSYSDKSYSTHNARKELLVSFARSRLYGEVDTAASEHSAVLIADLVSRVYDAAGMRKLKSYLGVKGWVYGDDKHSRSKLKLYIYIYSLYNQNFYTLNVHIHKRDTHESVSKKKKKIPPTIIWQNIHDNMLHNRIITT